MLKRLLFLLIFIAATPNLSAQKFSHGAGGIGAIFLGGDQVFTMYGFTYAPRFNIVEMNDNLSLSVGTKISLGFSGSADSRGGGSFNFMTDLPLLLGLNFGAGATDHYDSNIGGYVNAGLGLNYGSYAYDDFFGRAEASGLAMGPVFLAGVRFPVRDRLFGISGSFLPSITKKNKAKVVAIRGVYYF